MASHLRILACLLLKVILLLLFISQNIYAFGSSNLHIKLCNFADSSSSIEIVVNGHGKSLEEARSNALRSAIEQAFGTFISSKTEILNDRLLNDEIVSISNGNVQRYEIISEERFTDYSYFSTLRVWVSVDNLTKLCVSKGISTEFDGGLFSVNIKLQLLNEEAEIKAVENLIFMLHPILLQSFNYSVEYEPPISVDGGSTNWMIKYKISSLSNANMKHIGIRLSKLLESISLRSHDVETFNKLHKNYFTLSLNEVTYHLRTNEALQLLSLLISDINLSMRNFVLSDGLDKIIGIHEIGPSWSSMAIAGGSLISGGGCTKQYNGFNFINIDSGAIKGDFVIERTYDNTQINKIKKIQIESNYRYSNLGKLENGGRIFYEDSNFTMIYSLKSHKVPKSIIDKIDECITANEIGSGLFNTAQIQKKIDTTNIICKEIFRKNRPIYGQWCIPSLEESILMTKSFLLFNDFNAVMHGWDASSWFIDATGSYLTSSFNNGSNFENLFVKKGESQDGFYVESANLALIKYIPKNTKYNWIKKPNCGN
jgi:hypothetical protein